jgi:hypothetical protein
MPDGNGAEFPSSGDPRVDAALARLRAHNDGRFKDLEDAMLVQAQLEKRAGERIKDHAELIAEHHASIRRHNQWLRNFETKMSEMEDKVHFLIDREMKREGGPEAV